MIYTDDTQIRDGQEPAILAIGDSWFWYPANNILLEVARQVRAEYSNIFSIGYVGAKLAEYMPGGRYGATFAQQLRTDAAKYYSAVLISGSGNDAVDWSFALCEDCSAFTDPLACIDSDRLRILLDTIEQNYRQLIAQILHSFAIAGCRAPAIFLHTYDHPPVNGLGFAGARSGPLGPWITNAMNRCGVAADRELRDDTAALFIDRLQTRLANLEGASVRCVQSVGSLDPATDWANELHPTQHGFTKVVATAWRPRLAEAGMCA